MSFWVWVIAYYLVMIPCIIFAIFVSIFSVIFVVPAEAIKEMNKTIKEKYAEHNARKTL